MFSLIYPIPAFRICFKTFKVGLKYYMWLSLYVLIGKQVYSMHKILCGKAGQSLRILNLSSYTCNSFTNKEIMVYSGKHFNSPDV